MLAALRSSRGVEMASRGAGGLTRTTGATGLTTPPVVVSPTTGPAIPVTTTSASRGRTRLAVSETPLPPGTTATAPPLVILHGLLGQARNFRSWARGLAPTLTTAPRRVIALDLRNHGDSFAHASMGFDEMATDVLETLDDLGIESAALVGHSLGGKVAMAAAFRAASRVERLCVFDMAPTAYSIADGTQWRANRQLIQALADLDLASLPDRRAADARLARDVLDPNIRAFALSNLVVDDVDKSLSWKCNLDAILANLDHLALWDYAGDGALAYRYDGPTLFLAGANSRYIRSTHLADIERSFPNFALRTVPDAGHWIHAEAPQATQDFTREFLEYNVLPP